MDNIRKVIVEQISQIGAGESLLIFTSDQDTFIKFDAKLNGLIQMTADNGNIDVVMSRDNIEKVVDDFSVAEEVKELPLKIVKLNADGQIQVDGEPDTYLTADSDGIADRSNVPLGHQVKAALLSVLPNLSETTLKDLHGDGSNLNFNFENGFEIHVYSDEKLGQLSITFNSPLAEVKQIEAHQKNFINTPLTFLVRSTYQENPYLGNWVSFRVDLPAIPFIAQHLAFALGKLSAAMNDWTNNYGGKIV